MGLGGSSVPYQGMLFGMTDRNSAAASTMWRLWDAVRISESTMVGWREDDAMVQVKANASEQTFATAYVTYGKQVVIVVATWSASAQAVTLELDWDAFGLAPSTKITAPKLDGLQDAANISLDSVPVRAKSGLILLATSGGEPLRFDSTI